MTHTYRHYTSRFIGLYFCRFRSSRVLRVRLHRLEYRIAWSFGFAAERVKPTPESVVDVLIAEMERTA